MAANIIEFAWAAKSRSYTSASLPMPDGTLRRYREYDRRPKERLESILAQWQADCFELEAAMFLAAYQG